MNGDHLPITALLPDSTASPVLLFDGQSALRMAVVERDWINGLDTDWDTPGVYVLLDPINADGTYGCYVGQAPAGLKARLGAHVRAKDHWRRALLVARDTTFGFHSAHVGWLEGRLYELLAAAEYATLHNGNQPKDETLPPYERQTLEAAVTPIARVLRLLGYSTETEDEAPTPTKKRTSRFHGITVKDLIDAGLLAAGTHLVSTNTVYPGTATVEADGQITVGGATYPSPSAAGTALRGGMATNGWDLWAVDDGKRTRLSAIRTKYVEAKKGQPTGS